MTKNLEEHGLFCSVQQRTNHKDFQNCLFAYFLSQEEPKKMDVKSAFLYGKIEEEVYVCQPPVFEDPNFPDRFEKMMRIVSNGSMGESHSFMSASKAEGRDGIFIQSKKKYVTEILKEIGFMMFKTNKTLWKLKAWLKEKMVEEVDVNLYRSMMGSLFPHGEQQLQALVDAKKIVVTEASVRRDLQLDDEEVQRSRKNWGKGSAMQLIPITYPSLLNLHHLNLKGNKNLGGLRRRTPRELTSLKRRVKELEKKGGHETYKLRYYTRLRGMDSPIDESDLSSLSYWRTSLEVEREGNRKGNLEYYELVSFVLWTMGELKLRAVSNKYVHATDLILLRAILGVLQYLPKEYMAGWKPKDLKNKSFANIQELFDKAFKRVNTFVDFRTELVEGTEMEESSRKLKYGKKVLLKESRDSIERIQKSRSLD
ncbi:hypothetical protein Tco_0503250 [Tanacetum coccineum]